VLAKDGEGARVVLTPEDVEITSKEEEKDRIKHLGVFDFDIKIKGTKDSVRRTIRVNAVE
jgi:fructose-bisphosphate aldolase class II